MFLIDERPEMTTWQYDPEEAQYTLTVGECEATVRQTSAKTWQAELVTGGSVKTYQCGLRLEDAQVWCLSLLTGLDAADLCADASSATITTVGSDDRHDGSAGRHDV